jgi:lysyl-tRNA synthetase class II
MLMTGSASIRDVLLFPYMRRNRGLTAAKPV